MDYSLLETTTTEFPTTTEFTLADYESGPSNFTSESNGSINYPQYTYTYCGPGYEKFWDTLEPIVLVVNVVLCSFGICANILNIVVYSRKRMINPINTILGGIALADIVVMTAYLPQFVAKLQFIRESHPFAVAVIWISHEYFLAVFHPISVWLTMMLAVWRYIAVLHPLKSRYLCTMKRAKIAMVLIFFINTIICIPGYLNVTIVESDETKNWKHGGCDSKYCARWPELNFLRKIEFLYNGFLSKVVPSMILTFVSFRLILALVKAREDRKKFTSGDGGIKSSPNKINSNNNNNNTAIEIMPSNSKSSTFTTQESKREFDRTTKMLLVVLLLFLFTEIPPASVYILEVFFGQAFYFECRRPFHYPILFMYFLSGTFNFSVYILMSKNYRETLTGLFSTPVRNWRQWRENSRLIKSSLKQSRDAPKIVCGRD